MITEALLEAIDRGRQGKAQGYSIGLPKLEQVIDGVCKGAYYLIGAESGVGKSSFMLYSFIYRPLMDHLDDGKFRISLFSLEMNAEMIMAKLLSTYIFEKYNKRLSLKQLLSAQRGFILDDKNYEIVKECIPWLHKVEEVLTIYDKNASANSIYSCLNKELEARGTFTELEKRKIYTPDDPDLIHLVVIDHLARIFPSGGNTLKQEMDLTSKYLYSLKNRCGITPIVIQQLNRGIQSMDRRKEAMVIPMTSDYKDSNSTIEDAEIVLAIFSPNRLKLSSHRGYDIKELGDRFRSIIVLKSRYGEADVEDFIYYDGKCNKWTELPRASDIYDYSIFDNPKWYIDNMKGIEYTEDTPKNNLKFTL
jgi:replicative DNA helicase